jgi:hypothetical protein
VSPALKPLRHSQLEDGHLANGLLRVRWPQPTTLLSRWGMRQHAFSLVALVFLFGLAPTHSSLQAGVTGAAQSQRRSAQPPEQDRATKTFTGKIVQSIESVA